MKQRILALAGVCLFALAACDHGPSYQPDPNTPTKEDNECPRSDGQPCR